MTVPNLEERVMTGTEEGLTDIANLVSAVLTMCYSCEVIFYCSFAKVRLGPEAMTRRPSKETS